MEQHVFVCIFYFVNVIWWILFIEKKVCDSVPTNQNGILPCTGQFEEAIDSGNECICQCLEGFTNTSGVCTSSKLYTMKLGKNILFLFSMNSIGKCYMW
jgi:hypothetical protein